MGFQLGQSWQLVSQHSGRRFSDHCLPIRGVGIQPFLTRRGQRRWERYLVFLGCLLLNHFFFTYIVVVQLIVRWVEAMLAQHCADIEKASEHGVLLERARVQAQMAAHSAKTEQTRQELAEESSKLASLFQEIEKLRLNASVELNRRVHADERVQWAEDEHKVMDDRLLKVGEKRRILSEQLSKALGDRATAEEELRAE